MRILKYPTTPFRVIRHRKSPNEQIRRTIIFADDYIEEHPTTTILEAYLAISRELDRNDWLYPCYGGVCKVGMNIRTRWVNGSITISYKRNGDFTKPIYTIKNY